MLLMWAFLKNEFNMKVRRGSLLAIVMGGGADTGSVIRKMSRQIDRFSMNCSVIRSVINPSETHAGSPPDQWRDEEVYTLNADTVHIMLMWFLPSVEIYYVCSEDVVVLAVKPLLQNVHWVRAGGQLPIRQNLKMKVQQQNKMFCIVWEDLENFQWAQPTFKVEWVLCLNTVFCWPLSRLSSCWLSRVPETVRPLTSWPAHWRF